MDKSRESELFGYVYGKCKDWDVISSESPDFVCIRNKVPVLGAEITDLYHTESDARLRKIDGYGLALLSGGDFRHKDDKRRIRVERVKYLKGGKGPGREITAIIQERPSFAEAVSRLINTIEQKEQRVEAYLRACPVVDLIVDDPSRMFWFEKYEDFFLPFSQLSNRIAIINSRFREVFLVTSNQQNIIVRIPLKLSLFAEDVTIYEELILNTSKSKKRGDPTKWLSILLCCLFQSGYENIGVENIDGCIGLVVGSHLYLYSREGKVIRDYITMPEGLPKAELISETFHKAGESERQIAGRLIRERSGYKCCMALYSEVKKD